jgi:hypothetical protein
MAYFEKYNPTASKTLKIILRIMYILLGAILLLLAFFTWPRGDYGSFYSLGYEITKLFVFPIAAIHLFILIKNSYLAQKHRIEADAMMDANQKRLIESSREAGSRIIATGSSTIISNSPGASVINSSDLRNAIVSRYSQEADLTESLTVIAGFLSASKNEAAIEYFNEFSKKLSEGDSKLTLKSLWKQIVEIVPGVVKLGEAALKIAHFLGI